MLITTPPITTNEMLETLTHKGHFAAPFIAPDALPAVLEAAKAVEYTQLPTTLADGKVQQEIFHNTVTFNEGILGALATAAKRYIEELFASIEPWLFQYQPLDFNEVPIQKYLPGGGITPHCDGRWFKNLTALLIIDGDGDLCFCNDRQGTNAVRADTTPGNLILFPASGFMEMNNTAFHYLDAVTTERYMMALRQNSCANNAV